MAAWARGVCRLSDLMICSFGSLMSLTRQKPGRSRRRRKPSMPGTLVTSRSMPFPVKIEGMAIMRLEKCSQIFKLRRSSIYI